MWCILLNYQAKMMWSLRIHLSSKEMLATFRHQSKSGKEMLRSMTLTFRNRRIPQFHSNLGLHGEVWLGYHGRGGTVSVVLHQAHARRSANAGTLWMALRWQPDVHYMQLVRGQTLEEAWPSLSEQEINLICEQLRRCVAGWRGLRQESEPYSSVRQATSAQIMITVLTLEGHIGGQGVGDIIFSDAGDANAGPFENLTAFHNFFARYSCRRHLEWNPRRDFPGLAGLTDDRPVVFTHVDLNTRNIMVSSPGNDPDSTPRVIAILDWHQSGWYPADWEWLKAQWMCEPLEGGGYTA